MRKFCADLKKLSTAPDAKICLTGNLLGAQILGMTIDDYLLATGETATAFAVRVPISDSSLSRIRRGEANCTRDTMRAIIDASGGLISAESLVHGSASNAGADGASSGKIAANSTTEDVTA